LEENRRLFEGVKCLHRVTVPHASARGDKGTCPRNLEEGLPDDDQIDSLEGSIIQPLKPYLYGRFVYASVGVVGINQFCYKWDNKMGFILAGDKTGFEKGGPSAYNGHT